MPQTVDEIPVVTGSVLNPSAFEKGGALGLGSFQPGVGAAADYETDQLSLMLVKGIRDTLPACNTPFTISSDDQQSSDFYLDGHIDDYGRDKRFTHIQLRKNQIHLSVDGEIWIRETGEKVFAFQTATVIDLKTQDPKAAAYQMGVAIAHSIGSRSNS